MDLTAEEAKTLIDGMLEIAKSIRAGYKYSDDEKMVPTAIITGQTQSLIMALMWRNAREKYAMMEMVAAKAREENADAVAVATDSRWTNSEAFCSYFKLPPPAEVGIDNFKRMYHHILNTQAGGEIRNLPREIWNEAVIVFMKGPGLGIQSRLAAYVEGPGDTVQFIDTPQLDGWTTQADLIPEWWITQ